MNIHGRLALSLFSRLMGKKPTSDDKLELGWRRQLFMKRLNTFEEEAMTLFLDVDFAGPEFQVLPTMDEYEDEEDLELLKESTSHGDTDLPEYREIILPSAFTNLLGTMNMARLVEIEL